MQALYCRPKRRRRSTCCDVIETCVGSSLRAGRRNPQALHQRLETADGERAGIPTPWSPSEDSYEMLIVNLWRRPIQNRPHRVADDEPTVPPGTDPVSLIPLACEGVIV